MTRSEELRDGIERRKAAAVVAAKELAGFNDGADEKDPATPRRRAILEADLQLAQNDVVVLGRMLDALMGVPAK